MQNNKIGRCWTLTGKEKTIRIEKSYVMKVGKQHVRHSRKDGVVRVNDDNSK